MARQPNLHPGLSRQNQLLFQPEELFSSRIDPVGRILVEGGTTVDCFVGVVHVDRVEGDEEERRGNGFEGVVAPSSESVRVVLGDKGIPYTVRRSYIR